MLIELSIIPVGRNEHTSGVLAEALKLIDDSGLPYVLTPSATCIEGEWHEVMPIIRRCHARMRTLCAHVVTTIKIEDDGSTNKLGTNVASVEEKAGRSLHRDHAIPPVVTLKEPAPGQSKAPLEPQPVPVARHGRSVHPAKSAVEPPKIAHYR